MDSAGWDLKCDAGAEDSFAGGGADNGERADEPPAAVSRYARSLPTPDLVQLSDQAGVDAASLTDNQIAEALLQMR